MVLPISTTHDQPAHHMLELNLLEFAEWLLADGSNFSLFQETSHYILIIINYHPLYFIIFQSDSHYIPFIYPQIFLTYPEIPLVSSNILTYHLTSSNILKYSSNTLEYPQIFLRYSSNIPHISWNILWYPQISSNII